MRRSHKTLVALAAAVALVIFTAAPGAAQPGTVTGGTFTINITPTFTGTLAPGTDPNCASSLDLDLPSSLTSGTGSLVLKIPYAFGSPFIIELAYTTLHVSSSHVTTGTGASTHTITAGSSTGGGFTATATSISIYPSTGLHSCTRSSTTPACVALNAAFPQLTGTLTGTVTHSTTSQHTLDGTLLLNAFTANFAAAGCTVLASSLNGKTGTFTGVTIDY